MILFDANNIRVIEYNHLGVVAAIEVKQAVVANYGKAK